MLGKQSVKLRTMVILLALLPLLFGVGNICCATVPQNSTDMLSLLAFKNAISNDPTNFFESWNSSTTFCQWKGVTCGQMHTERVVALRLTGHGLSGQISSSVGNLTFLRKLDLSSNDFSGRLPPLNNLHKLQVLNLSDNSLQERLPDALANCTNLRTLDLSMNSLVGGIPSKLGYISNLSVLWLSSNRLTGTIPPTISNLTHMEEMSLARNQLVGIIPNGLGKLSNMSFLALGENNLAGEFPLDLFNLSNSLKVLGLNNNRLGNTLPPNIGETLPNLKMLLLNNNMFEGHIPVSLGNATKIQSLQLARNNFTGRIPSFAKLSDLYVLNLEQNNLEASDRNSWGFLYALTNCSSLKSLSLSTNQLYGAIPDSVGQLSANLRNLLLGGNHLSGIVPPSIGNLRSLIQLALNDNINLSGTIGGWIGNLTELQSLSLNNNSFTGPIPSSIGNLNLSKLRLGNNGFEGSIPRSLGKLPQLSTLDLSYNNLQGNIPLEISKLTQLVNLNLSSNKLTGEIPYTLDKYPTIQIINLAQNSLSGNIPESFGNLNSLSMLNLSHNNLSGAIPKALNRLQNVELDLSYNHLQGEIPRNGVFENAAAVSLEGNWGLCGGAMDLHMPPCATISQKKLRSYYLIRILIPIFGFMSLALLLYFLLVERKTPRTYLSSPPLGENFLRVSYNDLAQATMNFSESNLIGRGSYGSVYKGKLKETKMEVAVKVFDLEMRGAEKSFLSECGALRSIQHRNLLPIITACSTVDSNGHVFKALVYEFMPNGNLDSWLHNKGDGKAPKRLGLYQRISIAANIADAVDYLHHDCGRTTIHCDLKPSNILLDDDMNALLGDFGIASFYMDPQSGSMGSISSIGLKGTIGYIAPEYAGGGRRASTWGDVYSFGIILLEMMTSKRPTDPMFKDGLNIVNFVESNFPHEIFHVIDSHLTEECKDFAQANGEPGKALYQCFVSLLQVALSCTNPLPSERMNMKEVASKMHALKASYLGQKAKKDVSLDLE